MSPRCSRPRFLSKCNNWPNTSFVITTYFSPSAPWVAPTRTSPKRLKKFHSRRKRIVCSHCWTRTSVSEWHRRHAASPSVCSRRIENERCLVFVETKRSADYLGALLSQKKLMSTTMHGDRTQQQRIEAVRQFTNGQCQVLVATSVAARGLDFPLIGYVVNYDLPDSSDFYIHRIGRTGKIAARLRREAEQQHAFLSFFSCRSSWSFG